MHAVAAETWFVLLLTEFTFLWGNSSAVFVQLLRPKRLVPFMPFLLVSSCLFWWEVPSWQPCQNTLQYAQRKCNGDVSESCFILPTSVWLGSLTEEPLLKGKCLLKLPYLLSSKIFVVSFSPVEIASKGIDLTGFSLFLFFFFSYEVNSYPLGIALGNSCLYIVCQKVLNC